jgi:protein gp37
MMSDRYWKAPLRWNRDAEAAGTMARVFSASLADVFEDHPVSAVHAQQDVARARLWDLIDQTPWLVWMLLTKRPDNVAAMVPWGTRWPANVWIGTSVEDQRWADIRIPILLGLPATVRFISCEPLVGPVQLRPEWLAPPAITCARGGRATASDCGAVAQFGRLLASQGSGPRYLDWLIAGGESGAKALPSHPDWFRALRDQSVHYGLPYHFKQWGQWGLEPARRPDGTAKRTRFHSLANDGTLYAPGELTYPDGPRYAEAIRAGHDKAQLTAVYRVGPKAAGRLLDGRTWDECPNVAAA